MVQAPVTATISRRHIILKLYEKEVKYGALSPIVTTGIGS